MNLTVVERKTRLIGAILVERGLITPVQLREALELQAERGGLLGEIVTAEFGVSQVQVSQVIAEQLADLETAGAGAESSPAARPQLRQVGQPADGEMYMRVGDALLELGLVSRAQIDAALEVQRKSGERLGEILVGQGVISRLELAGALSEHWASLTKLRGPGEPGVPADQTSASEVSESEVDALATLLDRVSAKLDAISSGAGGDGDVGAQLERLSAKIDELGPAAPSDHLTGELERLSGRLDELAAAMPSDQIGALGAGQRRGEEILDRLASEVAGLREEAGAKLEAIAGVAGGDAELAGQVERLSGRLEELAAAVPAQIRSLGEGKRRGEEILDRLASEVAGLREEAGAKLEAIVGVAGGDGELAGQVERLSGRLEELAAAVSVDQLVERIGALDEGQRRGEQVLGGLVSDFAGLREEAGAKLEAIAGVAGGDGELAGQVERLSGRLEELSAGHDLEVAERFERLSVRLDEVAAVPSDRFGSLDEGQRRGEQILARLVAELAGLREETEAKLEAIASAPRGEGELAAQVERLSARFDELLAGELVGRLEGLSVRLDEVAAVPSDHFGSLDEGQRRGEQILARLVAELAGLREETEAKLEAIASAPRGEGELAAQVERLSAKVNELVTSTSADLLEERIGSLDQGQRRGEEILGRVVSGLAALREEADARLDASERTTADDQELASQVQRLSATIHELGAAPSDQLAGQVERLSARLDELVAAVPSDQIASLGEGQRRGEEILGRLASELAALRDEADAKLDAIASADATRSRVAPAELEALAAALEGVVAGLEERGAVRDGELAAQVERLSARVGELVAGAPADQLADQLAARIDSLGEAQCRAEATLERLLAELAGLRERAEVKPGPTEVTADPADGLHATKKTKKKRKKKH